MKLRRLEKLAILALVIFCGCCSHAAPAVCKHEDPLDAVHGLWVACEHYCGEMVPPQLAVRVTVDDFDTQNCRCRKAPDQP